MIHSVYFIDTGGRLMFTRKYGTIELNPDLMAGFLTAIKEFSGEISAGANKGDSVKEIEMETFNVIYDFRSSNGLMCVLLHDKKDDPRIVRGVAKIILDGFLKKYDVEPEKWDGNTNKFSEFGTLVDEILKKGKVAEVYPVLKKKLTSLTVKLGMINDLEYQIASKCDGTKTYREIADKVGVDLETIYGTMSKLKDLGLIKEENPE
ncbi:MAG: hypothetical protein WED04_05610 [Promethearchaeati archaeon SRVP18_Atabeyarchaeia-1]